MNKFFLMLAMVAITFWIACKDEDDPVDIYEYHAHIHSPGTDDKHLGDTLRIDVEFESHTGEPVHHINVRIVNLSTQAEVYNQPAEAHVHATSGVYVFEDEVVLSVANGFGEGDWVLEATVWGHEEGIEEVSESVQFHVHQ
jgi:hypothetical protein